MEDESYKCITNVWCIGEPVPWSYSLAPASRCRDVGDPVVLDTTLRWSPSGVHSGCRFIKHIQVSGRSMRHWKIHRYKNIAITTRMIYLTLKG